jgi:hypothetical protein
MSEAIKFEEVNTSLTLEEYERLVKEMQNNAVGLLSTEFKKIFDQYPEVHAIAWTQYTPYFNDGDACEFNIHDINFKLTPDGILKSGVTLKDLPETDEDDEIGSEYFWESDIPYSSDRTAFGDQLHEAEKALNKFAESFEDLFKKAFGDHSEIICTREGFQIDECSHD